MAVRPGEESKSIDTAAGLWQGMFELGADRQSVIVAVGGGVVGDLAGFIAATYARGDSLSASPDHAVGPSR